MKARLVHVSSPQAKPQLWSLLLQGLPNMDSPTTPTPTPMSQNTSGSLSRNNTTKLTYYDRLKSAMSHDEFIQHIIHENEQLKALVYKQEAWIDALTSQLRAHDIVPAIQKPPTLLSNGMPSRESLLAHPLPLPREQPAVSPERLKKDLPDVPQHTVLQEIPASGVEPSPESEYDDDDDEDHLSQSDVVEQRVAQRVSMVHSEYDADTTIGDFDMPEPEANDSGAAIGPGAASGSDSAMGSASSVPAISRTANLHMEAPTKEDLAQSDTSTSSVSTPTVRKRGNLEQRLNPTGGVHLSPRLASIAAAAASQITPDYIPTTPTPTKTSFEEEQDVPERSARRRRESVRIDHPTSRFQELEERERQQKEEIEKDKAERKAEAQAQESEQMGQEKHATKSDIVRKGTVGSETSVSQAEKQAENQRIEAEKAADKQRFERIEMELEKVRANKRAQERLTRETNELQAKLDLDIISSYEHEDDEHITKETDPPRDSIYSEDGLDPQISILSDDFKLNRTNSIVSQDKNQSNSSFNSYKSRLRLPPTLAQQQPQQPQQLQHHPIQAAVSPKSFPAGGQKQSLPQNGPPPLLLSKPSNLSQVATNRDIGLKPAAIVASTVIEVPPLLPSSTRITTPTNQTSSVFDQNKEGIPYTPEAIGQGYNGGVRHVEDQETKSITSPEVIANRLIGQVSQISPSKSEYGSIANSDTIMKTPQGQHGYSVESFGTLNTKVACSSGGSQSNSSFNVLHTPRVDETELFIKPEEFHTIDILVLSTLYINSSRRVDEPNITIAVSDRETGKEMWKIRKTLNQLLIFDNEIRPIVDHFGLPHLPDRSLFQSTSPAKIDSRKNIIQNYFKTLFLMPHIPSLVLYCICKFVSLDFINPLDDFRSGARKEGYLIRRYKGLGSSWKIRWCQVDGPTLEVYEAPGGQLLEQIKLRGSQIGRQSSDSVAEDKGYRHAFLLMEAQKTSKLSSSLPRHFFCAESDDERDEWIDCLVEFNGSMDDSYSTHSSETDLTLTPSTYNNTSVSSYHLQQNLQFLQPHQQNIHSSGGTGDYDSRGYASTLTSPISMNYNGDQDIGDDSSLSHREKAAAVASAAASAAARKMKKRSIFPFRANKGQEQSIASSSSVATAAVLPGSGGIGGTGGTVVNLENEPMSNSSSMQYVASTPNAETSMQHYLDQMNLDTDVSKAIFGRDVVEAFNLSNDNYYGRQIPSIILRCLDFLTKTGGVFEEGIFRLSGSASSIRQLKELFNKNFDVDLFDCPIQPDIHTVAGLLKTYLRDLPSPILGAVAANGLKFIATSLGGNDKAALAFAFRDFINNPENMDQINYDTCYVIFKFLTQIIANNSSNRMNLRNICIVFVPTLNISLDVLSLLLVDFECIFERGQPIPNSKREVLDLYIPNF